MAGEYNATMGRGRSQSVPRHTQTQSTGPQGGGEPSRGWLPMHLARNGGGQVQSCEEHEAEAEVLIALEIYASPKCQSSTYRLILCMSVPFFAFLRK